MFTGIIEETGIVTAIASGNEFIRLAVSMRQCGRGLKRGDSLAVNGCCLTVVAAARHLKKIEARFDLLRETWDRTNLQFVRVGSAVNLERSLAASARLGGHFVSGHVDAVGRIARWEREGQDHVIEVEAPAEVMRYVVLKGSIAVDGISLTIAAVSRRRFRIWIIPHTLKATALRERRVGDAVNLEVDLLAKYVEKLLPGKRPVARTLLK